MIAIEGVDYSAGAIPSAALRAAGKKFVSRYLARDRRGITAEEVRELTSGGIEIISNYEGVADRFREGYGAGQIDARFAQGVLVEIGLPPEQPIYFSCDFDATPEDQAIIDDYLHGVASVIGIERTGVYGGFWVVKRCHENGTARWLWQTYAWSGGQIYPDIHIHQYNNYNNSIGGVDVDLDRALQANYGQASLYRGGTPTTTTTPAPQPTHPPKRVPAPDRIEAQGHALVPNKPSRFVSTQGGHFKTAPSREAPDGVKTPYAAGKTYTFPYKATVDGEDWYVSAAGSWAPARNFK